MNQNNNFQSTQEVTLEESKMARLMFLKQEKEVLFRIILELLQQAVEFHVEPWPRGVYYALYVKQEQAALLQEMKDSLVEASLGQKKEDPMEALSTETFQQPMANGFHQDI